MTNPTDLQEAVFNGQAARVRSLLEHNSDIDISETLSSYTRYNIPFASWQRWSLLAYAVYYRYVDIVELLLKNKANPNETIPNGMYGGWPLLAYAIYQRDYTTAKLLLANNAKIDAPIPVSAVTAYGYFLNRQEIRAKSTQLFLNTIVDKMYHQHSTARFQLRTYQWYLRDDVPQFSKPSSIKFYNEALFDVAMMLGTLLDTNAQTAETRLLLKKIYYLVDQAGLYIRNADNSWAPWQQAGLPLATALCRGSKILIQLPKKDRALRKDFEHWLGGFKQKAIRVASHDIKVINDCRIVDHPAKHKWLQEVSDAFGVGHVTEEVVGGTIETGKAWLNWAKGRAPGEARAPNAPHFGFNLALGGVGNINPISNRYIEPNGEHGQLYICRPTSIKHTTPGILVTIEPSAPKKTSQNGHYHGPTAASSRTGINNGCVFGENRGDIIGMFYRDQMGPATYRDSLFVDLSNDNILRQIMSRFDEDLDLRFICEFPDTVNYLQ